jgi:hypothetical protein
VSGKRRLCCDTDESMFHASACVAMRDAEKLIAWLREAADELEKAHAYLDAINAPRRVPGSDVDCTLAARIALLVA